MPVRRRQDPRPEHRGHPPRRPPQARPPHGPRRARHRLGWTRRRRPDRKRHAETQAARIPRESRFRAGFDRIRNLLALEPEAAVAAWRRLSKTTPNRVSGRSRRALVRGGGTVRGRSTAPRKGEPMVTISKKVGGISALGLALSAAMMVGQVASAAVFDFETLADNVKTATGYERNWNDVDGADVGNAVSGFSGNTFTVGGIGVIASGSNVNETFSEAFLDSTDGSGRAGLGVCSTEPAGGGGLFSGCGTTKLALNTADDNVSGIQGGETLNLQFVGGPVSIMGATFRNATHKLYDNTTTERTGTFALYKNGTLFSSTASFVNFLWSSLGSDVTSLGFKYTGKEFYLSTITAVPLPAGVLLLGSALGGLGLMKRRRKAA